MRSVLLLLSPFFASAGAAAERSDPAAAHTPRAIVRKLNADVNDALAQPEVRKRLADLSMDIAGGSPEDATKYVMGQAERVRGLIKAGVLTPE